MSAQIYYSPFIPAFSSNGAPVPGAKLYFFLTGTDTLATVYSDSTQTTVLQNPVVADLSGKFPNVFLDSDVTYRVKTTDPAGIPLGDDIDPYIPGQAYSSVADLPVLVAPDGASKIGYRSTSDSSTTTLYAAVKALGVTAGDAGAKFDGSTNDATAIQKMIDLGNANGVPVLLPGASAVINTPLNLKGRYVDLRGITGKTSLRAGASMATMIDCAETSEVSSYSPLSLSGISLDGDNKVSDANLSLRFRRDYILDELFSQKTNRGFRLKDANNGSMRRCRTSAVQIGLHSEGSNHATNHDGCSFINASQTAVLIENKGTALDGNNGLLFNACVVQDGAGDGFDVAASCSANLYGSYVGETTNGFNFVNRGGVITVNGGIVYFGFQSGNYVTRPLGGAIYFREAQVFSQNASRGISHICGLAPGEGTGKVKFTDCNFQIPVAGNNFFNGDVLISDQRTVFAPRLGRVYIPETNNVNQTTALAGPFNNGRKVTVDSVTGTNPILGLQAMLTNPNTWRNGEPFYLVVVYSSSKTVNVRTSTGVLTGAVTTLGAMPASAAVATYVKVETIASADPQTMIEFFMTDVVAGDNLTIHQVGFADASMLKNGVGVLPNLFLP